MGNIYQVDSEIAQVSRTVLYTASGGDSWVGRSNIVELSNGVWAHTYRSAVSHFNDDGELHIRFSNTQGLTWTAEDTTLAGAAMTGFPIDGHGAGVDATEGVLVVAPNGDALCLVREELTGGSNGTYVWRSTNSGATWTDEGQINSDDTLLMGGQAIVVGSVIYAVFWVDAGADQAPPFKSTLYKSTNNGTTWTLVSDVTSTSEATDEIGLIQLRDGTLLTALRVTAATTTYMRRSDDLGLTWGDLEDVGSQFGVLQRPKFRRIGERIYLHARDFAGAGTGGRTVLYWSDNEAETWNGPFYINDANISDVNYGDLMQRGNGVGNLYGVWYEGASSYDTSIVEYVLNAN